MIPGRLPLLRSSGWAALAAVALLSGCFSSHKRKESLPIPTDAPLHPADVYSLACPDVVEVVFTDRPDQGILSRVAADGCIRLGALASVRVEGDTMTEAAGRVAERVGIAPEKVMVQVVEYNSRHVFLFGQVKGEPRLVDYRGPETVVDLLRRTGGLTPDAAPDEIYVVRAQLGEGIPAEVLTVDLDAILNKDDQSTNIRVLPLDEIYVGEATRSRIGKAIPTFIKPLYQSVVELLPRRSRPSKPATQPAK